MAKTVKDKVRAKVGAKIAKAKAKVARKCGKSVAAVALLSCLALLAGCLGTTTPSRSQNLTIKDCTVNIYGGGAETGDVARVEIASQAMSIENSGTETQTVTPTQTTDVKPDIDVHYNDALKNATDASRGVLETLTAAGASKVLSLMSDKSTATVEVEKKDGGTATVKCENGQCSTCTDGSCTVNP